VITPRGLSSVCISCRHFFHGSFTLLHSPPLLCYTPPPPHFRSAQTVQPVTYPSSPPFLHKPCST
jgi:hypothetical protein